MPGFEYVTDYIYPAGFDSLAKIEGWAQDIWKQLSEREHGFAEDLENTMSQNHFFKTITGITNDVVADQQEDTLTLAGDSTITITGTAATDTITYTWAHLGIESLADPGADRIAFWDDGETAFKWLAPDGTTIGISGTTLQVIQAGIDHGTLAGLADDDHPQYIKDSEFTQDSGVLVGTGAGTFAEETGDTLRTSLGLAIGTNVQAWDADLDTYAGITPSANIQTFLANANFAAMMADLSETAGATFDWNAQNLTNIGTIASGIVTTTTVKLTDLTDGYIPYHVSDALGLANSGIYWDSVNSRVGIGLTVPSYKFQVETSVHGIVAAFTENTGLGQIQGLYISVDSDDLPYLTKLYSTGTQAGDMAFYSGSREVLRIGIDRHVDIYDWNDSTMREIDFGADDSGGSGHKVLRVPN